jgi:hypothetical protein
MVKKEGNLQKKSFRTSNVSISLLIIFFMSFSIVFCSFIFECNVSGSNSFTPYPPSGNITTDINIENEYIIYTSEVGSSWMFDWGDGIFSNWIYVTDSDDYISQPHTWNSYGDYEVRIKQRNLLLHLQI